MKKAIIKMLSILCVGLMIVSSAGESIYAASYSNPKQQVSVQAKSSKKVTTKKATNKKSSTKKTTVKKQTKKHNKNHKKTNKSNKVLTKAQALKLVKKLEPEIKGFTYMGNENTYKCIKQKVLSLPVIRIYEDGKILDETSNGDVTIENIENMIKKFV